MNHPPLHLKSTPRFRRLPASSSRLLCLGLLMGSLTTRAVDTVPPESVGISTDRLAAMHQFVEDAVQSYPLTGAITLISRHGQIADFKLYGYQDAITGVPMRADAMFRIHSISKLITSAAAMILIEEGKLTLSDPVEKYLPALADRRVVVDRSGDEWATRPAEQTMTIRHLLTHTAGFPRGRYVNHELDKLYEKSRYLEARSFSEMIERLAPLPLLKDPGEEWIYSLSIDVLSAVIEVASGQAFDEFLQQRIFDPLEMYDTHFVVPHPKRERLVSVFNAQDGKLVYAIDPATNGGWIRSFPSGSGGLYSTILDVHRFAQMLLDHGRYGEKSVLSKKSVEAMMMNQIGFTKTGRRGAALSDGFGFGGAVKLDPHHDNQLTSIGTFGWGGAATTWLRIDPQEQFIAMFFTQQFRMAVPLISPFANTAWQTMTE